MSVTMTILSAWNADSIIRAAGGTQDLAAPAVVDAAGTSITVTVLGCTQAALDAAVAAYDHTAGMRVYMVGQVRAEADRRIGAAMSWFKHNRLIGRQAELAAKGLASFTGPELAQWNAILGQLAPLVAIGAAADTIETEVNTYTVAQIAAYDVTTDSRWPA